MTTAELPVIHKVRFKGKIGSFFLDTTPFIDLEGALNSGKTTVCLWKELHALQTKPGIWSFIGRYADGDNEAKLKPAFEAILHAAQQEARWNAKELCYDFPNDSKAYSFGFRPQDALGRYSKIRGLGVSRVYIDQAEEMPDDFFGELAQRIRQQGYPHQYTLSPNPLNVNSWLAEEFPDDNTRPNRKYYSISLFDNAHNLPPGKVEMALATYPPSHAKHRTAVLGLRGLNVTGTPVYKGMFDRSIHVQRLGYNRRSTLLAGFDFGKHHPCVVFAQQPYTGGLHMLAGILGQDMYLDDFIPAVQGKLQEWFPDIEEVKWCCDPAGHHQNSQGARYNGVDIMRRYGIVPRWVDNSNAPDVRVACIENVGGYMRRRSSTGECFSVNSDPARWIRLSSAGPLPEPFVADACEAGYVWDEHMVSVGSKQVRRPKKDGWYEHGMNCTEYIELNFGAQRGSQESRDEATRKARTASAGPPGPERGHWLGM